MRSRLILCVALLGLAFLPTAARPDDDAKQKSTSPALVIRLRSLDGILEDARYLAAQVGKAEEAKQAEAMLKEKAGGDKGLEGIDTSKPIGLYLVAGPNGTDSYGALMIPVKDEKALLGALKNFNVEAKPSKDGLYTVKHEKLPVPVFFRFANGYAYVTAMNEAGIAKNKLIAPSEALADDAALLSATIRIDQIPDSLKEMGVGYLSLAAAQAREDKLEGQTKAQKELAEQSVKESMANVKSLLNEGHALSINLNVDRKKGDLALEFILDAKPGTKLATHIKELGEVKSLFAGLISKDSAINGLLTYTFPERLRKAMGPVIDEAIKDAVQKAPDEAHKAIAQKLTNALMPTLKSGDLDAAVDLRGPSAKKHYTLVAGIKIKDGEAVDKAVRDVVKDLPENAREIIKLDAQKVGDVAIHEVKVMDDNIRETFGDEPLRVAIRSNALYVALGENGLAALKEAMNAPPASAGMFQLNVALAHLAPIMAKEQPAAPKAAEDAFGKHAGSDKVRISVNGGSTLKTEVHVKPAVLKFFTEIGEGSKRTSEK
jgi:hypothetical protein